MRRPLRLLPIATLASLAAAAEPDHPALRLTLHNLTPGKGQLLIGVCLEHEFLTARCTWRTIVAASANPQLVLVPAEALPAGRYAVQIVYDRNANAKLDTSFMGIPREPVGFSRNASGRFGPPKFAQAAIAYDGVAQDLTIDLR